MSILLIGSVSLNERRAHQRKAEVVMYEYTLMLMDMRQCNFKGGALS